MDGEWSVAHNDAIGMKTNTLLRLRSFQALGFVVDIPLQLAFWCMPWCAPISIDVPRICTWFVQVLLRGIAVQLGAPVISHVLLRLLQPVVATVAQPYVRLLSGVTVSPLRGSLEITMILNPTGLIRLAGIEHSLSLIHI